MRYFEIAGGLRIELNEEEHEMLEALDHMPQIDDQDLNERGQEVARKMTSRGILNRLSKDGKIYYEANGLQDIWRI